MEKVKNFSEFRKNILTAAFLLLAVVPALADDDWTKVENNEAGKLSEAVGDQKLTIAKLKVSGSINGADLLCLREMAGRNVSGGQTKGNLAELDLSGASIVASDDVYFKSTDKDGNVTEYKITEPNVLGANAFKQCSKLRKITLPSSLTAIGDEAFRGCTGMGTFTFPDGVKTIGSNAFNSCTALTSVTIPSSVTSIGAYAFKSCTGLTSVTIGGGAIDTRAFQGCTALTSVEFGNGVTSKADSFKDCTSLASVTINGTSISANAFKGVDLTSVWVIIPQNAVGGLSTKIGDDYKLEIIKLKVSGNINGADLLCLREMAGRDVKGDNTGGKLAELDLSDASIVEDATNAYYTNKDNTSYYITANNVLGDYAFASCTRLKNVTLPSNLTGIGNNAFDRCSGLETFTVSKNVTSIGNQAFYSCTGMTSASIAGGAIGARTFQGCTALTSVEFGDDVASIGGNAFYECSSLESVAIPEKVTSIENCTFSGCSKLASVTIGSQVTSIGSDAFKGCEALNFVRVKAQTPPQCKETSFVNISATPLYVPCGTKEAYQAAKVWPSFTNIIEDHDYSVTIQPSENGSAQIVSYTCDNKLTLQADAAENYHFTQWRDGNKENPRTITLTSDMTFQAEFAADSDTPTALDNATIADLRTENGRIICDSDFQIFDLLGRNVTRQNGSLNGVYVVKCGDKAQKVVVR